MADNNLQIREWRLGSAVAMMCVGGLVLSGCAERRARAFPWATAIQVRPIPVARSGAAQEEAGDATPDLEYVIPPPVSRVVNVRSVPARPRVAAASSAESSAGGKLDAVDLIADLSPAEIAEAQHQTNESLATAQHNLDAARARRLRPSQMDLASKVNGFINDAREAEREGDWTRARNLSQKAQVLSEQLAATF